jgi:predicted aspartyl protease
MTKPLAGSALLIALLAGGAPPAEAPRSDAVVLPLEFSAGRPLIALKIDGKGPYRLLLDTGSGAELVLDRDLAAALGLKPTGTRRIGDPNAPTAIEAQVVRVPRVEVGELSLRNVQAMTWDRSAMGATEVPQGVVGLSLFGARVVTLDYPAKRLILESGDLPEADGKTVFKASFEDGIPSLPIDVAGTSLRAHLDSGSTGFLGLPIDLAAKLPLDAPPVRVGRARTASGDYAVTEARLEGYASVAGIVLERPKLHFVNLPIGNLGSDLLRSLIVSVDRKNERVRLVSSGAPIEASERPRLGVLTYGLKDGRLPVESVAPGSPAEAAGVRAGDQIVRLNDRAVAELSGAQLGEAMQGRPLAIGLVRDGQTIEIKIESAAR